MGGTFFSDGKFDGKASPVCTFRVRPDSVIDEAESGESLVPNYVPDESVSKDVGIVDQLNMGEKLKSESIPKNFDNLVVGDIIGEHVDYFQDLENDRLELSLASPKGNSTMVGAASLMGQDYKSPSSKHILSLGVFLHNPISPLGSKKVGLWTAKSASQC